MLRLVCRTPRCLRVGRGVPVGTSGLVHRTRGADSDAHGLGHRRAATSSAAIVVEQFGAFACVERPSPPLPSSHILVEVVSAAVNPADTYIVQGIYTILPTLPFTPGIEGAGRVVAVGQDVREFAVGDAVAFAVTAADGGIAASSGSWAGFCAVQANLALKVPAGMDLVAAAAVPISYLTAHRALFHAAQTQPGDRVLVRGASGAVGQALVHLARHFGAPGRLVVGTASSEAGCELVRQRGGLATGHSEEEVHRAAESFDVIVELMADRNLGSDLRLLAPGGRIAVVGSRPGGAPVEVDARQALVKEAAIRGVFLWKQTEVERRAAFRDIFHAFSADMRPPQVRSFKLSDAQSAFEAVSAQAKGQGATEGKVVLLPEGDVSVRAEKPTLPSRDATRQAAAAATVIDVHAHAQLEETLGAAGRFGPEVGESDGKPWFRIGDYFLHGVKYRGSPFMDVSVRIDKMNRDGIDLQVLSPNPLTFFHHIPVEDAVAFCRRHNDTLSSLVAEHPDRLAGLAALPMQSPELAMKELTHAVKCGLLGGYIGTDFGIPLDDPRLDPFYAHCCELDVPLFMHPAPKGIDGPSGDERLRRFELDVVIGFNLETTVAVSTLVYGGVLERHPRLDICLPSGGGAVAYLAGRMAAATAAPRQWVPPELLPEGAFHKQLRRLWFDTHVHDDGALRLLRQHCGDEHLVYGTNFAGWDQAAGPNPPDLSGIDVTGNARRLLRLL